MNNALSLRSYTKQFHCHAHEYHQMVLTLSGHIEIEVEEYKGKVSVGEAIIIKSREEHSFRACEEAKFIVADTDSLPSNMISADKRKFPISGALLAYIQFLEKQLQTPITTSIEKQLFDLFFNLIKNEPIIGRIDRRIERAIALIHQDLSQHHSNTELAKVACLGQTQFKKLFTDYTGMSVSQYTTSVKMEKARSLLTYTDHPITQIALELGYKNASAFTRRFSQYFSQPPSQFCKKC